MAEEGVKKTVTMAARYQGTSTKAIRATKKTYVKCTKNPKIVHEYEENEVIGAEPKMHHYVFGSPGGDISGGFYIRVGVEVPDFIELHAEGVIVELSDLGLVLEF